ncbi:hypothetical protein CsSME_00046294 [Camellia sinensis var. sinensis]
MAEIVAKAMAVSKDDNMPKSIITKKLNGANYLAWAHAVKIFLHGMKKSRFLGKLPPATDDKAYDDWCSKDFCVMS